MKTTETDKHSSDMKEQRLDILQKVANGELTPEQADEQLCGWQKMSVLDTVAHAYGSKLEQQGYGFAKVRGTQLSKV